MLSSTPPSFEDSWVRCFELHSSQAHRSKSWDECICKHVP
jgi:hypothetical protein